MVKKILNILIIQIIILSSLTLIKINHESIKETAIPSFLIIHKQKNKDKLGKLSIESLNINELIYQIGSEENTVDKHVTILKESILPDKEKSIVFLAAHSGTGENSYFENLKNITVNTIVKLTINKKEYKYIVKEIWEDRKDGFININKEDKNQLILTTCSPFNKNKQLIVSCIEKESN